MYIITKKKDYYDGVAGTTGIDKTIIYDRQIVEIEENDHPKVFRKYSAWSNKNPSPFYKLGNIDVKKELRVVYEHAAIFIIGFCGKLYVGCKLYSVGKNKLPYGGKELITTITYDLDCLKNIIETYAWSGNFEDNLNYILTYNPIEFFREFNAPVFVYDNDYGRTYVPIGSWRNNRKFIINPLLKEYEFYKVFNAVQAFQEISMFLSGVLGTEEKEIVEVADKYKIAGRGFDKWSFRKMPEKNRKKNKH